MGIPALTPRRWAVIRTMLRVLTEAGHPVTLVSLAEACPPRLEYVPCYGHHALGVGVVSLDCDGEVHRVVRDTTTVAIGGEVDLLRSMDWVALLPRSAETKVGGMASLYDYTGPAGSVDSLMAATFRWQPARRPPRCPVDDDTYVDFYPDPAKEVLR